MLRGSSGNRVLHALACPLAVSVQRSFRLDARLEKIHPPVYWKALDYRRTDAKRKAAVELVRQNKAARTGERACEHACRYTTLIYKYPIEKRNGEKGFQVFVDFEHAELEHIAWKEPIGQQPNRSLLAQRSEKEPARLNAIRNQQTLNERYLHQRELARYFQRHTERERMFAVDATPYPNRPMALSRRPRDALHIDFYQANQFAGLKAEATFRTFYHRKYLVSAVRASISILLFSV